MFEKDIAKKLDEIGSLEVGIHPCDFTRKSFRAEPILFKDFTKQLFPKEDLSKLTPEELYYKFILAEEDMSVGTTLNRYGFRISKKEQRENIERMYAYQALVNTLEIIYQNLLSNRERKVIKRYSKNFQDNNF